MQLESLQRDQRIPNIATFLEDMVRESGGEKVCQTIELRRKEDAFADARMFFKESAWLTSPSGQDLVRQLTDNPSIADVYIKPTTLSLRFSEQLLADLGADFESSNPHTLNVSDLLPSRKFVVGFVGPNTNKALHIGHLRNLTIGNALASILETAGAQVVRQSLVGDVGRSVCEAMAGYKRYHDGEDPLTLGLKPDHFVGKIYSDYNQTYNSPRYSNAPLDPIERETEVVNDLADTFMRRWLAGDREVYELWHRIREWVLIGHRETLARLGLHIDRHDFESDTLADIDQLLKRMVSHGIVRRDPSGRVVYASGRSEFEEMILARQDGFPTEHARLVAMYCRLYAELEGNSTYLDLAGTEWQPASGLHLELVQRVLSSNDEETHVQLFHGMVTINDAKMASRDGQALLIDKLLDQLLKSPEVQSLAKSAKGGVGVETVADIVVKGFFLCRPVMKGLEFSWNKLLNEKHNPGWLLARALCHARLPEQPGLTAAGTNNANRLALIRSQDFRRNIRQATRTYSLSGLSSYLIHLCEVFLEQPKEAQLTRVMQPLLDATLSSLGLLATVSQKQALSMSAPVE